MTLRGFALATTRFDAAATSAGILPATAVKVLQNMMRKRERLALRTSSDAIPFADVARLVSAVLPSGASSP